ncbi:MAG: cytochrome c oxidase subunit II [Metallosphaera sp.]
MKMERLFEILTIVFSITVLVILGYMAYSYLIVIDNGLYNGQPPTNVTVIRVIAFQYGWKFIYPNGTVSIDTLTIKANQTYLLLLNSTDVIHTFYIPQLGYKFEAIPGEEYKIYLVVNKPGTYDIYCAEFCGPGHYLMLGKLVVVS